MNIQKEEEGCELDKSDRVRREKRGRGRQKIQTSRRLMSECASANGQQGKWDTFTWLSCAVWTSSMFICLVRLLELDPLMLSPLLVSRVQILAPPHTSCHPLGASLSLELIDRLSRHSGCVYSFLILQPRKENVSLKSPSLKSPGSTCSEPLEVNCKVKAASVPPTVPRTHQSELCDITKGTVTPPRLASVPAVWDRPLFADCLSPSKHVKGTKKRESKVYFW